MRSIHVAALREAPNQNLTRRDTPNNNDGNGNGNDSNAEFIQGLVNNLTSEQHKNTTQPGTKIKVLTNCKANACLLLACPNIKDHCTLCEVKKKNWLNCHKYPTKFLVTYSHDG